MGSQNFKVKYLVFNVSKVRDDPYYFKYFPKVFKNLRCEYVCDEDEEDIEDDEFCYVCSHEGVVDTSYYDLFEVDVLSEVTVHFPPITLLPYPLTFMTFTLLTESVGEREHKLYRHELLNEDYYKLKQFHEEYCEVDGDELDIKIHNTSINTLLKVLDKNVEFRHDVIKTIINRVKLDFDRYIVGEEKERVETMLKVLEKIEEKRESLREFLKLFQKLLLSHLR